MLKAAAIIRSTWRPLLARFIAQLCRTMFSYPWLIQLCTLRSYAACLGIRRSIRKDTVPDRIRKCVEIVAEGIKKELGV